MLLFREVKFDLHYLVEIEFFDYFVIYVFGFKEYLRDYRSLTRVIRVLAFFIG